MGAGKINLEDGFAERNARISDGLSAAKFAPGCNSNLHFLLTALQEPRDGFAGKKTPKFSAVFLAPKCVPVAFSSEGANKKPEDGVAAKRTD